MTKQAEKHSFQAEVNEVLSIVVHSLYSNREIFLRELISNASDALDKLSFRALTEHDLLPGDEELRVELIPDREARTLTIRDNGVGMTKQDLIDNLGTIARSGSKKLMESIQDKDVGSDKLSLIGQFGVGFYSAFLVADNVVVTSRHVDSEEAWQWESEAKGEFSIETAERAARGTDIVLHMKEDADEYLETWGVQNLVRKYSDYVRFPIRLEMETSKQEGEGDDAKTVTETEWKTINEARALWRRSKSDVTDEQYDEFYKHLAHDWESPLARAHFKVEGTQELAGLLFVPSRAPMDLFEKKARGLKLFVKRVFIMDDAEALLPEWLRFVKGVIDSEDLPLNVSRELLQDNASSRFIRKQVIAKTLALLDEMANEGEVTSGENGGTTERRYIKFWQQFGIVLKEGFHYDPTHKDELAKLLRYRSTADDAAGGSAEGWTSLQEYVTRMPADQESIYYVQADSLATARTSPHIEALVNRGFEVLFMIDAIDEWVVNGIGEFDGKKLLSAAKGDLDLPKDEESEKKQEARKTEFKDLIEQVQGALSDRGVKEVRLTDRLTDSPACLVADPEGLSPQMERMMRASGQDVPPQQRILELNPDHAAVLQLQKLGESDAVRAKEWAALLHDQALLAEGTLPDDPAAFAKAITKLMTDGA